MSITTDEARKLASEYPVGPGMRAFAGGSAVSYERFMAELEMVSSEYSFEAFDDVRALRNWAESTDDPVWADI